MLLALVSGLACWIAFPPYGWWPVAPVGVASLAVAARGQRTPRALLLGAIGGLVTFVPLLSWSGTYVGKLPWFALATAESVFVALLGALLPAAWRVRGGPVATVAAVTGLWVAQEAARGRVPFGGFPWGRLAFSQSGAPTLGYAALGGAPLVTAAVAAAGGCLAVGVATLLPGSRATADGPTSRPAPGGGPGPASRLRRVGTVVALLVGPAVLGAGALVPRPVGAQQGNVRISAVQGNVPEPGLEFNARRRAVLDNHAAATMRLADEVRAGQVPAPDLVVWPENSSDIDPLRNRDAAAVIQAAADDIGVPVVVGAVLREPVGHQSNAAILWGPSNGPRPGPGQLYVKRHPAPFAEYVPFRSFFRHFSDKVDLAGNFVPGHRTGVFEVGPVRAGDVICFEVAHDSLVRDPVRAGANLLMVQTNNATFGYSAESPQQLAMSRLRAVETGRAVVHVSTVGESALILPDGRAVERTSLFTQRVLSARLPLRTGQTLAVRLGEWPEAVLAVLGLVLLLTAAPGGTRLPAAPPGALHGRLRRQERPPGPDLPPGPDPDRGGST